MHFDGIDMVDGDGIEEVVVVGWVVVGEQG